MGGSLEFAKLVTASLLYQYWSTINKWLRFYLSATEDENEYLKILYANDSKDFYKYSEKFAFETQQKMEILLKKSNFI